MSKTSLVMIIVLAALCVGLGVALIVTTVSGNPNTTEPNEKYEITLVNNENYGTVSGGGKYEENESVALWAQPKEGYSFYGWYSGGKYVSFEQLYTVMVKTSPMSFTAVYSENLPKSDYIELIIGNLYMMDFEALLKKDNLTATDIAPVFDGITLGELFMANNKLPVDVTSNSKFRSVYDLSVSGILSGDAETTERLKNCYLGALADIIFSGAKYKTSALKNAITALYDVSAAAIFEGDMINIGVELISALGTLKMQDVFDSYVQVPATISYFEVYKAMKDSKVASILAGADSEENIARRDALTIRDFLDFYYALSGKTMPTYKGFAMFVDAIGEINLGELRKNIDVQIDKLSDFIAKLLQVLNKPFSEILEETIVVPDFIKSMSWYQEIGAMTIGKILKDLYAAASTESPSVNYLNEPIVEIIKNITSVTDEEIVKCKEFFDSLEGKTLYSICVDLINKGLKGNEE